MRKRKRSEPHTFEQRLEQHKIRLEDELAKLPSGEYRDSVTARLEQLQTAAEIYEFLSLRHEPAG